MLTFQIKSLQHSIVKHCVKLRKDSSYRKESKSLLVLGKKQLLELPHHINILKTFTLDPHPFLTRTKQHYQISEEIFKKITGMSSPEPYIAEVSLPEIPITSLQRLLICDAISDPGNLGTLLRTALSFGFDAAFLLNHCVDPFNEKALRAGKGAIFHLPLLYGNWDDLQSLQNQYSLSFYQADMHGTSFINTRIISPFGLILGNEAHGTSKETKSNATSISIPMISTMESLNVAIAGGVLMFNTSLLCQKTTTI